jgi:hypothetical protein
MGFLSGPITFECFRINGAPPDHFGTQHVEILKRFAISQTETSSLDQAAVGFLAGGHLLDLDFDLEKNVIGDALHCGVRIDSNPIPAAVRKAWLQMELAALGADNPGGKPTKAQRQEAKDAVAARCEEEAQSGRFRRMQQFPVLWDARDGLLCFGGSSPTASDLCCDLFIRAFDLELERLTAGRRAQEWAAAAKRRKALEEVVPSAFRGPAATADIAWHNHEAGNFDFLGNEFLMWLWWYWETESDTLTLADDSEVTGMLARTLSLQCPRDESGKETITAEAPVRLPEAAQAIRSGKLPRKSGLTLVRHGAQYDLVLQAETFAISGAKIQAAENEETADGRGILEDRIESFRGLQETLDLLYGAFCERRIGKSWPGELEKVRRWLKSDATKTRRPAG